MPDSSVRKDDVVSDVSFIVRPSRVTGFLGPNGAGKTTTLRMMLDLLAPTAGRATFDGVQSRDVPRPTIGGGLSMNARIRSEFITEYHARTISQTFLAEPRRLVVFAAKLVVGIVFSAALAAAVMIVTTAVVALALTATGTDPALTSAAVASRIAGAVLTLTLWGLIGVGVGALVRNQLVAVVVVLAFTQFVEPMLRVLAGSAGFTGALEYLPGSASDNASGGTLLSLATDAPAAQQTLGIGVLVVYVLVAVLAGAVRFRRPVIA